MKDVNVIVPNEACCPGRLVGQHNGKNQQGSPKPTLPIYRYRMTLIGGNNFSRTVFWRSRLALSFVLSWGASALPLHFEDANFAVAAVQCPKNEGCVPALYFLHPWLDF